MSNFTLINDNPRLFEVKLVKGDKGDKGNTGDPAGFGTPTSSITLLPAGSTPSVVITASGTDTAKVFDFDFNIPKASPELASDVTYDNTNSGLTADDVQEAIDELAQEKVGIAELENGDVEPAKSVLADNFDSKLVLNEQSAYLFRTTAGGEEVGTPCKVKSIMGGSLPIIQVVNKNSFPATQTVNGVTFTNNDDGTFTVNGTAGTGGALLTLVNYQIEAGFIVYQFGCPKGGTEGGYRFAGDYGNGSIGKNNNPSATGYNGNIVIAEGVTVNNLVFKPQIIMVNETFGTTVANRIYALEQAEAGSGIAKLKELLVKDYYPYNRTAFTHVKTTGKQYTKFNQFNLKWFADTYPTKCTMNDNVLEVDSTSGAGALYNTGIPVDILGNETGGTYITFEGKCGTAVTPRIKVVYEDGTYAEINFTSTSWTKQTRLLATKKITSIRFNWATAGTFSIRNLCINLHWDGERDGEYEDYDAQTYPVDDVELKGIISLDANDKWVYDGDIYRNSGSINRRFLIVAIGSLADWTYNTENQWFSSTSIRDTILPPKTTNLLANVRITNGFENVSRAVIGTDATDKRYAVNAQGNLLIRDLNYGENDIDAFKTAYANIYLIYEVATPTTESANLFTEQQNDDNWGTEKWLDTRAVPLPVYSDTDYLPDLKAKLESAPSNPDTDGDYIMHRENGENSYSSLASWLSDNGYEKPVDLSSGITDAVGLTYTKKKCEITGKRVTLHMLLINNTENSIPADSSLFTLPSEACPSGASIWLTGILRNISASTNTIAEISISTGGVVRLANAPFPSGNRLYILITYFAI